MQSISDIIKSACQEIINSRGIDDEVVEYWFNMQKTYSVELKKRRELEIISSTDIIRKLAEQILNI